MSKNKKMIILGIVIAIVIIGLAVVLSVSNNNMKKSKISESESLEATNEQSVSEANEGNEENEPEETTQSNDGVSVQNSNIATHTADTSKWDTTKVDIVYDTANEAVPVPKGYVASGADGEHTVNTGFVIYEGTEEVTNDNAWNESCKRNQWVWVPVPDVSRIYETDANGKKKSKLYSFSATGRSTYTNSNYEPGVLSSRDNEEYFSRYGMQGMTTEIFLKEMQDEFEETIKSIQTYGGFWIGRYETGNLAEDEPVVQRMNTSIGSQNWYTAYKKMSTGTNVRTNIIWGCLWDETLQWFVDSGAKTYAELKDSTSWGNYSNSTFEYKTNTSGSTSTKSSGSCRIIPSGSTEYSKANNIYDMAGNVVDWTLEGYGSGSRRYRGGSDVSFGSSLPVSYRDNGSPDNRSNDCGFRAYLYIK